MLDKYFKKTLGDNGARAFDFFVGGKTPVSAVYPFTSPEQFKEARARLKFIEDQFPGSEVLQPIRESLQGSDISRVYGILNGTCNYILTLMEQEGRSFADVLKEAQKQGYAEADPTFDIGGFDTAHKLAILTSLAFGTAVDSEAVHVEGIQSITLGFRILRAITDSNAPEPLKTLAAKAIPGFEDLESMWSDRAPLGWDEKDLEPPIVDLTPSPAISSSERARPRST